MRLLNRELSLAPDTSTHVHNATTTVDKGEHVYPPRTGKFVRDARDHPVTPRAKLAT
jgi:hypothetical protein